MIGFILSKNWKRGFNVFSLTIVLILLCLSTMAIDGTCNLLNLLARVVSPKAETVVRLTRSLVRYVGVIAVIYFALAFFGVDSESLLASAGLMTLVIGLGAKDLITDVLAGLFIIFEGEFQVGDIIELGGTKGTVLDIGIRTTKILDVKQNIKSVANRNVTNVVNRTKRNSYVDISLRCAYTADQEKIDQIFKTEFARIARNHPEIIEGPYYSGIDSLENGGKILAIRAECQEKDTFLVRTILNEEILKICTENGIELK